MSEAESESLGPTDVAANSVAALAAGESKAKDTPGNSAGHSQDEHPAEENTSNPSQKSVPPVDMESQPTTTTSTVFKMPIIAPRLGIRKKSGGLANAFSENEKADKEQMAEQEPVQATPTQIPVKKEPVVSAEPCATTPNKSNVSEVVKQPPIPYKEPDWGGNCPEPYSFEVIKNGTVVNTIDLTKKSFFVFGRLPSCDISMEHPSLSRYHAVAQHCAVENNKHPIGWYLYDLDSTHGTWVNKIKVKPRVYIRLRVGHVIKFGGSTRLHILQGPADDQDAESELSITEIKQLKEKQAREAEVLRMAGIESQEVVKRLAEKKEDEGCSWGIDEDAEEEDMVNPFAQAEPLNEDLYIEDPKKALRGYFEREGLDLPEYEIQDGGKGKYRCMVELPIDSVSGEPIVAEAIVSGKKKEAVIACALEACRILDKHGELRKAKHESRARKKKNWEEEDFYDSDDDTFLDRTGDIEKKRQKRMKQFGKDVKKVETYESLVGQLETIESEMKEIQEKLDKAKRDSQTLEEDGLDALDAFMMSIKSGNSIDTKTKMKLKRQLFDLKQEHQRLQKLVNIAKPAALPGIPKAQSAGSERLTPKMMPIFGKKKGISKSVIKPSMAPLKTQVVPADLDGGDEEEEEEEPTDVAKTSEPSSASSSKPEETTTDTAKQQTSPELTATELHSELVVLTSSKPDKHHVSDVLPIISQNENDSSRRSVSDKKVPYNPGLGHATVEPPLKKKKQVKLGDSHPPIVGPTENDKYEDPDYQTWVPPSGQTGDGKTHLNAKFGY